MTFLRPEALWALLVVPAVIAVYALVAWRHCSTRPVAFTPTTISGGRTLGARRHVTAVIFLVALSGILLSLARPEANITLPVRTGQIVLAFDTSNSMLATDVSPTRLAVAKALALEFVDRQPGSVQIGVVAFTNGGLIVQPPTKNQVDIRAAIERLSTDGGTSIGEGIFASLAAIADEPIELNVDAISADVSALDLGTFSNAAIIVFSDGEEVGGADPVAIARLAANAEVPVYTVGVGTQRGAVVALDGFSIATALDEPMLSAIANTTGAQYFLAAKDPELQGIFDEIDQRFERQGERIEITALLAMAAMALITLATALSLRWFGRV